MEGLESIYEKVLKDISPSKHEKSRIESLANRIKEKVESSLKKLDINAEVRIEGSIAKDTWLSKEADIDIFMLFPPEIAKNKLKEIGLKVAYDAMEGYKTFERFAEHPYLEALVNGIKVNIVPCFKVEKGKWLSATDRTPFHTEYMKSRLSDGLKNEVRLLKKFMKGIETYGAEIKVSGFSGFLCEVLTLYYGSFEKVLKAASKWKLKQAIDIESYYKGREYELYDLFEDPLIVIDPIDKGRNAAAAVKKEKMWEFVAASRAFLENPSIKFFYPPKLDLPSNKAILKEIKDKKMNLIFIKFGKINAVVDVIWSQLFKTEKSLKNFLEKNDFHVIKSASWSDEELNNGIIFELEINPIPLIKKHLGPQVFRKEESKRFLEKHANAMDTISGPWIEGDRWAVEKVRKNFDSIALLKEKLKNGGREIGVAEKVSECFRKGGFEILSNEEIIDFYEKNNEFAIFFVKFLKSKKFWV
ncbi:MAG: CCA tRNA nucleotidyltransferase [Candidatus Bathyarchaeia archaeon]